MSFDKNKPIITPKGKPALLVNGALYRYVVVIIVATIIMMTVATCNILILFLFIFYFRKHSKIDKKRDNWGRIKVYFECTRCQTAPRSMCYGFVNPLEAVSTLAYTNGSPITIIEDISYPSQHNQYSNCIVGDVVVFNMMARQQVLDNHAQGIPQAYETMVKSLCDPNYTSPEYVAHLGVKDFPTKESLSSAMSRARLKQYPPLPKDVESFTLPVGSRLRKCLSTSFYENNGAFYAETRDVRFVLYLEPILDVHKMFVLATDEFLLKLCNSERIYVDGTFKVLPKQFHDIGRGAQLLTIHAPLNKDKLIPLVYAIIPGKSQEMYVAFLRKIKDHIHNTFPDTTFKFQSVMCDFEKALRNAFRSECFNGIQGTVYGCFFHFAQAVFRKIQAVQVLRFLYYHDRIGPENVVFAFRSFVKMLLALAFVPVEFVEEVYDMLVKEYQESYPLLVNLPELTEFLRYFTTEWLQNKQEWNVYELDNYWTNNALEGWHSALNKRLNAHPNLWTFIDKLKDLQYYNESLVHQVNAGAKVSSRRKSDIRIVERIQRLKELHVRISKEDVLVIENPIQYIQNVSANAVPDPTDESERRTTDVIPLALQNIVEGTAAMNSNNNVFNITVLRQILGTNNATKNENSDDEGTTGKEVSDDDESSLGETQHST